MNYEFRQLDYGLLHSKGQSIAAAMKIVEEAIGEHHRDLSESSPAPHLRSLMFPNQS
jgi:hypothetical protein